MDGTPPGVRYNDFRRLSKPTMLLERRRGG